jgi:exonuclease SbcC
LEDSVLQKQTVLAGVRTRHQQAATQCELARQAFESAAAALRLGEEKHALAVRAIQEWLVGFEERAGREVTVEEIGSWLERDHTSVERERADLQRIEAEIHTARGVWNACREACERHELGRPTAESLEVVREALEALKGSGNTAKKKVDERRSILWSDDQRKLQAGELLKALEEKRRRTEPWARLNAFIGSADGKAFRELAQQWTLDVLVKHANAQLEQLATRYYLKRLDKCLNLMVVDRQMSDQVRSVHSLSGGESFLVSLGLALGLASLTSNRMRIESLFIDEGFGSLDADTLRTAMGALAHLESQGRKVGIISHVAEMADAIPVQIRVVKGPGGASRIVVPDGRV